MCRLSTFGNHPIIWHYTVSADESVIAFIHKHTKRKKTHFVH